jgi:hypothetical protein
MANEIAKSLIELGVPTVLAEEFDKQLTADSYDARRLIELSFVPQAASYFARTASDGSLKATALCELGVPTEIAKFLSENVVRTPRVVGNPSISGDTGVGDELETDGGSAEGPGPITESVQWYRDDVAISGATNDTYTLVEADVGAMIKVGVVFTNSFGASPEAFSDEVGPITE